MKTETPATHEPPTSATPKTGGTRNTATAPDEPQVAIDTSKMSPEQRAALELTEAARDVTDAEPGFCGGLFMGKFHLNALHPFPQQDPAAKAEGAEA